MTLRSGYHSVSSSKRAARGRRVPPLQCIRISFWLCTSVLPQLKLNSIPHALTRSVRVSQVSLIALLD
jgi:hypothetical protein